MFTITALYKFVSLPDYKELQPKIKTFCDVLKIKGTLLLAEEGINGTICGSDAAIQEFLDFLKKDPRFADVGHKESYAEKQAFLRMKVRLKKEIVSLGVEGTDPNKTVGTYVDPKEWNDLISDPEVVVVDTRNIYEYEVGTFKGAEDPNTDTFREFPDYVEKNLDPQKNPRVAMFCTGGIRCEKASSYMLNHGFKNVYHLRGGILKYLEEVPEEESLWEGECFVFDDRVTVKHNLEEGTYDQCHGCRRPITQEDKESEHYEAGVSCPACYAVTDERKKQSARTRQQQIQLAKARGKMHLGDESQKRQTR